MGHTGPREGTKGSAEGWRGDYPVQPVRGAEKAVGGELMGQHEALERLLSMTDEMVYAKDIGPVLGKHPQFLINKVKNGEWDRANGNYLYFPGDKTVKFYRIDFLKKGGWIS